MECFVTRNGTIFGPMTFDQLVDAARAGQLSQDDSIWCAGMQSWMRASEVSDLWRASPRRVWRRAPKANTDARANHSSDRSVVRVNAWLISLCISLAIIGSALALVAMF